MRKKKNYYIKKEKSSSTKWIQKSGQSIDDITFSDGIREIGFDEWLEETAFDVVIVNTNTENHWSLYANEDFISEWCLVEASKYDAIMPYHVSSDYYIFKIC